MKAISNESLRERFIGWQLRIRQIAMREHGGRIEVASNAGEGTRFS